MEINYGYAIEYMYTGEGTLRIKTRVPSIHGPFKPQDANGKTLRNYVLEKDLPWYDSLILPRTPNYGDVVAMIGTTVIGLTGGNYGNMALDNI